MRDISKVNTAEIHQIAAYVAAYAKAKSGRRPPVITISKKAFKAIKKNT